MSKASFYRIPMKTKTVYAPRRRQKSQAEGREAVARQTGGVHEPGVAYHPAPQFRRNRRFWLRRLGLDKEPR
jgi:hypothetical protein